MKELKTCQRLVPGYFLWGVSYLTMTSWNMKSDTKSKNRVMASLGKVLIPQKTNVRRGGTKNQQRIVIYQNSH